MLKHEKTKKKSKQPTKESTNENNDSDEREIADEFLRTDMIPSSQPELYSNDSDKYERELNEHVNNDDEESVKDDGKVDETNNESEKGDETEDNKSEGDKNKNENSRHAKKPRKKEEVKNKGKKEKSSKRRQRNSNPNSENDERSKTKSRRSDDESSRESEMSSVTENSVIKKVKKGSPNFEHYDFVLFPFKEEWQRPDTQEEWGPEKVVERDEILRKKFYQRMTLN